jgi:hypothetical protein
MELLLSSAGQENYYRFDAELNGVNDEMDDASDQNLASLQAFARTLIATESEQLDAIAERL